MKLSYNDYKACKNYFLYSLCFETFNIFKDIEKLVDLEEEIEDPFFQQSIKKIFKVKYEHSKDTMVIFDLLEEDMWEAITDILYKTDFDLVKSQNYVFN